MSFKDRFYQSYTSAHVIHRKGEATLDRFRAEFPVWNKHFGNLLPPSRDARILDVGCGRGGMVYWLAHLGYRNAEGVDLSMEQVDSAHRLGIANVRQGDLTVYLRSRESHYDALILRDVIEHFTRDQIIEVLELCRRATRPGGVVIIQVPNAETPFSGRIRYGDFTHEIAFTSSSLTQLFNVLGYENLSIYPVEPAVTGVRSFLRYGLWLMAKAFYGMLLYAELGPGRRIFTQGLIASAQVPRSSPSRA